ncbi:hypothetical protein WN943_005767 [Citrus x changshan-huyou]
MSSYISDCVIGTALWLMYTDFKMNDAVSNPSILEKEMKLFSSNTSQKGKTKRSAILVELYNEERSPTKASRFINAEDCYDGDDDLHPFQIIQ